MQLSIEELMPDDKTGWGGRREGAGRKPLGPELVRRTVTLPVEIVAELEKLGGTEGDPENLSAGIREAVRRLHELRGTDTKSDTSTNGDR